DSRGALADGGEVAIVLVAENARRIVAGKSRPDGCRDMPALLLGCRCNARNETCLLPFDMGGVADGEDVRMAWHGEVGLHDQPPGTVGRDANPIGRRRSGDAGGPD